MVLPLRVKSAEASKKRTQPPKPHTEASLLSMMENAGRHIEDESLREQMKDSGLGTPATRAAIIERLIDVGYIERKSKALSPTEKGMKLIEVIPEDLKSAETTGRWEKGLSSVAKGKMDGERFMESICRFVGHLVAEAAKAIGKADKPAFPEVKYTKKAYKRKTGYTKKPNPPRARANPSRPAKGKPAP